MSNKIGEFNLETGEVILRDMTEKEIAQKELDIEAEKIRLAEKEIEDNAKLEKRNQLLEKLGITEEEAKLLLS